MINQFDKICFSVTVFIITKLSISVILFPKSHIFKCISHYFTLAIVVIIQE